MSRRKYDSSFFFLWFPCSHLFFTACHQGTGKPPEEVKKMDIERIASVYDFLGRVTI